MNKKILIISSKYTGHGHKSITDSLCEQIEKKEGFEYLVVDGFELSNKSAIEFGKIYGPITRNTKDAWRMMYAFAHSYHKGINAAVSPMIKRRFLKILNNYEPDVIVSDHPVFVGSILNILEAKEIKTPFVTLIADLVSISSLWIDERADYTICSTCEAKEFALERGLKPEQIKMLSFPVREQFTDGCIAGSLDYNKHKIPTFLIMSGGEGSGNLIIIAQILLNAFNSKVKIMCGRNNSLKEKLEETMARYGDRVEINGFCQDVKSHMLASDIAFLRGSPNTIMEAINCCLPVVITGALPGQEAGNPGYFGKNGLSVNFTKIKELRPLVKDLLDNDGEKLSIIRESQKKFRNLNAASDIVEFLAQI